MDWKTDSIVQAVEYDRLITDLAALTGRGYAYLRAKVSKVASESLLTPLEAAEWCVRRARVALPMPWEPQCCLTRAGADLATLRARVADYASEAEMFDQDTAPLKPE